MGMNVLTEWKIQEWSYSDVLILQLFRYPTSYIIVLRTHLDKI